MKNSFTEKSVKEARSLLQNLDTECEHGHYSRSYDIDLTSEELSCDNYFKELKGHPLHCCYGYCNSQLRLLRAGAVCYPALQTLLNSLYSARRTDIRIRQIETDRSEGHIQSLVANISIEEPSDLLDDERSFPVERISEKSESSLSTSESQLELEFVDIIQEFYDKLKQDVEFVCCCCERLLVKKALTHFNFTMENLAVQRGCS